MLAKHFPASPRRSNQGWGPPTRDDPCRFRTPCGGGANAPIGQRQHRALAPESCLSKGVGILFTVHIAVLFCFSFSTFSFSSQARALSLISVSLIPPSCCAARSQSEVFFLGLPISHPDSSTVIFVKRYLQTSGRYSISRYSRSCCSCLWFLGKPQLYRVFYTCSRPKDYQHILPSLLHLYYTYCTHSFVTQHSSSACHYRPPFTKGVKYSLPHVTLKDAFEAQEGG